MNTRTLKEQVYEANLELDRRALVIYTFGNVSQIDRGQSLVAIKPSGLSYQQMSVEDVVIVDLENKVVEGRLRPSSDTKTHTHLYRHLPEIGGVCHTHSTYATAWAQAQKPIPCFGTTHADYIHGEIPCTAMMRDEQIESDYEEETGGQITEHLRELGEMATTMILVSGHGPFTWGQDAAESVYHAAILEELARMALLTQMIEPGITPLKQALLDKHYHRKHGAHAYYGQSPARPAD